MHWPHSHPLSHLILLRLPSHTFNLFPSFPLSYWPLTTSWITRAGRTLTKSKVPPHKEHLPPQTPAEGGREAKGERGRRKKAAAFPQVVPPSGREIFHQTLQQDWASVLTSRCSEVRRSNGSESERAEKTPSEKGTL